MPRKPMYCFALLLLTACGSASAVAQSVDRPVSSASEELGDYTGVYEYRAGQTVALAPADTTLVAVIDRAKYRLRRLGRDRFLNGGGDTIPFRRDAEGRVTGFVERGRFFSRLTDTVPAEIMALLRPRAPGPGGPVARYTYRRPPALEVGLPVADAAVAGLDTAAVERLIDGVLDGTYPDVHSILVYRNGHLVLEEYFYGYDRGDPHQMRSATKSVVSAVVGAVVDRGKLAIDEPVLPRLPYVSYANPDPRKQALTLGDLLTMHSGLACNDWDADSPGHEVRVNESADWVKFVLDLPMISDPGQEARYCSGGVYVTGRMVEEATDEPLPMFAQRVLFEPLGIRTSDVRWDFTLSSENAGTFAQLYLRPRDMLKFGVLFHQGGEWQGRQVLSREWVEQSTSPVTTIGDQQYGYYWWHQYFHVHTPAGHRRVDMLLASGNGGQKIYIVPELDLVAVFTGGNYNAEQDSPPNAMMARVLLPALLRTQ